MYYGVHSLYEGFCFSFVPEFAFNKVAICFYFYEICQYDVVFLSTDPLIVPGISAVLPEVINTFMGCSCFILEKKLSAVSSQQNKRLADR